MQNTTVKSDGMVLLPVPLDLLDDIGLDPMDVIQMSAVDGKLVIEKVVDDDFKCDGNCENCPFFEIDCNGDCDNCPCFDECDEREDLCND
ncbi:MAG TPA: hypothetical protein DEP23_11875 [Ruminococcaceae bacterium]|nr:hypothetical protein [Oscillospiraceae bacterium]